MIDLLVGILAVLILVILVWAYVMVERSIEENPSGRIANLGHNLLDYVLFIAGLLLSLVCLSLVGMGIRFIFDF